MADREPSYDQHSVALAEALRELAARAIHVDAEPLRVFLAFPVGPFAHLVDRDPDGDRLSAGGGVAHVGVTAQVAQQRHSQHLLLLSSTVSLDRGAAGRHH